MVFKNLVTFTYAHLCSYVIHCMWMQRCSVIAATGGGGKFNLCMGILRRIVDLGVRAKYSFVIVTVAIFLL